MISAKTVLLALLASTAVALPIRREVPQEHSHNPVLASVRTSLAINNPAGIQDPVFGLLGNAAAAAGQGKITNTDCLQQATADQAFTNAKAKKDVQGMTQALIYRALERNTAKVGLASVACTAIKAVNPEIAALSQHQDPASAGAAATNKAITLALAKQIASIGGNAQDALKAGTFKPGNLNDNTGKGNTCDDANDTAGCIFTQKLIVEDATAQEITAAVAGVAAPAAAAATAAPPAAAAAAPPAAAAAAPPAAAAASTGAASFGSCSTPAITFAVGLDGRKETAFEPTDLKSFNHGSAQNIDIISRFICDTLTNSCKANQAAKDLCTKATAAADAVTAKTGGQADAFNAVFGGKTAFAAVQAIDDQGRPVGAAAAPAAAAAPPVAAAAPPAAAAASGAANFGSCSTPAITFAVGLDNRKETAFEPTDLKSFNHGSAQNIDIITQFICDTLTNSCKANQAAKDLCTKAKAAADTVTAKTGGQADAFNKVFGKATNFAAVQAIDDQGRPVGVAAAAAPAAAAPAAALVAAAPAAASGNFQKFTGALGGTPPAVVTGGKGFVVDGSDFINLNGALGRSCDVQHNACSTAANTKKQAGLTSVSQCDQQNNQCHALIQ